MRQNQRGGLILKIRSCFSVLTGAAPAVLAEPVAGRAAALVAARGVVAVPDADAPVLVHRALVNVDAGPETAKVGLGNKNE